MAKVAEEKFWFIIYNKDNDKELKLLSYKESIDYKLASKLVWHSRDEAGGRTGAESYLKYMEGVR